VFVFLGIGLLAAACVQLLRLFVTVTPALSAVAWVAAAIAIDRVAGRAPRGHALRPVVATGEANERVPEPPRGHPPAASWYVESRGDGALPFSCSFVEFDERGDYLDFEQHRHAYQKILDLTADRAPLTVVIYVHGWRHSGQSYDVVSFNEFLRQLSQADDSGGRRRVHGVYCAWRGASLRPAIPKDDTFRRVEQCFGGEIVDSRRRALFPYLNMAIETLSYWNRKGIPEYKFSATCISRTLFSCAFAARRNAPACELMLIGHSFGALMLERTFQNAAISLLTNAWPWGLPEAPGASINPLPFDTVLLVNSAAPSIYAKQFQGYLAAHRQAMVSAHVQHAATPIVFSLTSGADWATRFAHPLANMLAPFAPSLWRYYRGSEFILELTPAADGVTIPQSYYYRHTPGHNPLIVNRFIEPESADAPRDSVAFTTAAKKGGSNTWSINFPPVTSTNIRFSVYRGLRPLAWTRTERGWLKYRDTAYWIIRCPKTIIAGHNDIWSQAAMDTYAALNEIALHARR
jgi:hypothetical protein